MAKQSEIALANKKSKFMTAEELREYLGISISTYYTMTRRKQLPPYVCLGVKRKLYVRDLIDNWLKEQATNT